ERTAIIWASAAVAAAVYSMPILRAAPESSASIIKPITEVAIDSAALGRAQSRKTGATRETRMLRLTGLRARPFAVERGTRNGFGACLLPDMVTHQKKVADQRMGDDVAICDRECGCSPVIPTIP